MSARVWFTFEGDERTSEGFIGPHSDFGSPCVTETGDRQWTRHGTGYVGGPLPTIHASNTLGDKTLCGRVVQSHVGSDHHGHWTCRKCVAIWTAAGEPGPPWGLTP